MSEITRKLSRVDGKTVVYALWLMFVLGVALLDRFDIAIFGLVARWYLDWKERN